MNRSIDFRLLWISAAILSVAIVLAWLAIEMFRQLFPVISENSFWDELTGPTIGALAILAIKMLLYRQRTFHLQIVSKQRAASVYLSLLRRDAGFRLIYLPRFRPEAVVAGRPGMVRNVFWWGIRGVDLCLLCVKTAPNGACRMIEIPAGIIDDFGTVRLSIDRLTPKRHYRVTMHDVDVPAIVPVARKPQRH